MPAAAVDESLKKLLASIQSVFVGKEETVLRAVTTLIARGHLLIEDVPGIGKTLLGLALARSVEAVFRRIQFTNDMLPSDILGVSLYNQKDQRFEFRPGPIFSHVVLADEINRSTPKTQSALLEAMNEPQVSIDGRAHELPRPFMVIATENPVEHHGTFPLPEAQLDRFLMRVQIGYPSAEEERQILRGGEISERVKGIVPAMDCREVEELQARADAVHADDAILNYVVEIAQTTRRSPQLRLGLSPRGAQALLRAARAWA
ncbi:MAG TPA: AAA family ATPase, partial [Elusimicrobiota bacterium]|nr:AAA family ATPase [Elusimicrobiota bacterium]